MNEHKYQSQCSVIVKRLDNGGWECVTIPQPSQTYSGALTNTPLRKLKPILPLTSTPINVEPPFSGNITKHPCFIYLKNTQMRTGLNSFLYNPPKIKLLKKKDPIFGYYEVQKYLLNIRKKKFNNDYQNTLNINKLDSDCLLFPTCDYWFK